MKVKVKINSSNYWNWCTEYLQIGTWRMMIGFMGQSGTFIFDKPEDATMFVMVFGL